LDAALIAWDSWCDLNPGGSINKFAQDSGLSESLRVELERVITCGNNLGKLVVKGANNQKAAGIRIAAKNIQFEKVEKTLLAEELGQRFELKSPIGTGGMGVVWLAEQLRPIKRQVAIKLIRQDRISTASRRRFAFEQQALASMSHPNIASVLEAGETTSGRSYFIMEYFPSEKITDFCNQRKLDLKSRLSLFLQVCEGVKYAHRRGLIHRDLKPGNIIVSEVNGAPVAKVIDFGLAKDVESVLTDESLTQSKAIIGSPAWMSPEQAHVYLDGDKVDVDTRTDVYSLGVILYQLLTNSTPIRKKVFREVSPAKVFDAIRNETPAYPSRRLSEASNDAKGWIEESSNTSYSAWVNSLRDDLDWVVMKAIEKDADRRYEDVGEFANDLKRFMRGESVTARPPSKLYYLKKVIGRNRILTGSIATVATILVLATLIATGYAIKANRSQKLAEQRLNGSEQLAEVFAGAFEKFSYADNSVENTPLKKKLLREVLLEMERRSAEFPADLPPKELAHREYMWRTKCLGALESAEMDEEGVATLNKVIEYLEPVTQAHDERLLNSRISLIEFLVRLERMSQARKMAAENLDAVSNAFPPEHELSVRSRIVFLKSHFGDNNFRAERKMFSSIIDDAAKMAEGTFYQLEVMKLAASYAFNSQEIEHGIEWLDSALKLANEKLEDDDLLRIDLEFEYWEQVAFSQTKTDIDVELLESRIQALKSSLHEGHAIVIRHQITLARILGMLTYYGKVTKSEPVDLIKETLKTSIESLGVGDPLTSAARHELFRSLNSAGENQEIIKTFEAQQQLISENAGENAAFHQDCIAMYLDALINTQQFERLVKKADDFSFPFPREKAVGLMGLGRYSEATKILNEYVDNIQLSSNWDSYNLVPSYFTLALIAQKQKNYKRSNEYLRKAEKFASHLKPTNSFCLNIKDCLLRNYRSMGQPRQAIEEGEELVELLVNADHHANLKVRAELYTTCLGNLTEMCAIGKDYAAAKKWSLLYLENPIEHEDSPSQAHVFKMFVGHFELLQGNYDEAEKYLLEALHEIEKANSVLFRQKEVRQQTLSLLKKIKSRGMLKN
jgi:serine/threonine protein kinase